MAEVSNKDVIRGFLTDRRLTIISLMDQMDVNATGKTMQSLRVDAQDEAGQLFGARAFNLNSEGKVSLEYGSPAGTLVPKEDLKQWADAKGYTGNINRLQTRIFERGTVTVNNENPRLILQEAFNKSGVEQLVKGISRVNIQSVSSEILTMFKKK